MKKLVLGLLAAGTALAAAAPANAAVFIAYSLNGGPVTQVATGASSAGTTAPIAGFTTFDVRGSQYPSAPGLHDLYTQSLSIQSSGAAGTLSVFVTATDLPTLTTGLGSFFAVNRSLANATARISSFYSPTNALYGGTLLQTSNFTSGGTFEGANTVTAAGPFSLTTRYDLTFTGTGQGTVNASADITAVPEPATWGMMMLGFGAMGFALRRRRNVETRIRFA